MDYSITLTNKRVWDFYEQHKNINVDDMNVMFVEILEKLLNDSAASLNAGVARQLLDNVRTLQSQMNTFSDSFSKIQNDLMMNFTMKFSEFKKEYIDDIKMILSNNTSEKIAPLIERYNDILQDKTKILINDIIPKNQEVLKKDILTVMKALQENLNKEFDQISNQQLSPEILENFVIKIDDKFSKTLVNSQGVLNSMVSSSEQRITSKMSEIKDITATNSTIQQQVHTNLNEMLKKFENSSAKGRISENLLLNVIQTLYPIAEINTVAGTKESGDISLVRRDKPTILFENKNYDINVGKAEIEKFYRDIDVQNCHGILLSQKTAIVNKNNFEIEIYNGNVVVFLHNVNYDADKIRTAVDIIDHFQQVLIETSDNGEDDAEKMEIGKEKLEEINVEYNTFVLNKLNHIKTIKEYNQKILTQAENFKMPNLENILSKNFANSLSSKEQICEFCKFRAKNARALTAHLRACGENKGKRAELKNALQNIMINAKENIDNKKNKQDSEPKK
jgi:hypothetical protein